MVKELGPIIIAFIGIIIPALKLYIENKKLKKDNTNLKEEVKDKSHPIELDLMFFNGIKDIVQNIFNLTVADRFLILSATNGIREMRFASAIYEQHKHNEKISLSIGATNKYVKFEFDSEYKKMLKDSEQFGYVDLDIEKMNNCDLKTIYQSEGVKHSKVFFILRLKIDDLNDRIFYCSVATKENFEFTNVEKLLIKTQVDKMKAMFNKEYNN